jgi:UDP-N-acetylmuramoylalanine--D-glutamate ligase
MAALSFLSSEKPVLVLGLGESGFSAVRFLVSRGLSVRVADSRIDPPQANLLRQQYPQVSLALGPFSAQSFDGISLAIISPGVPLYEPEIAAAQARGIEVIGDVELFARVLGVEHPQVRGVAITGSNGKTTVTTLMGEIARAAGLNPFIGGNIGTPPLDALIEGFPFESFVLELSSFQLETLASLSLEAAVILNVSEDHLDRYSGGMKDYIAAKARIFDHARVQVVNRDDPVTLALGNDQAVSFGLNQPASARQWGLVEAGGKLWVAYAQAPLLAVDEMQLTGLHNAANVMAALALADAFGIDRNTSLAVIRSFRGLPHRVEKVREVGGVSWFDDSKGTNVGATLAALTGMPRPVVLIAGGDGKGQDFTPLKAALEQHGRALVQIGRDGPLIAQSVAGVSIPVVRAADMEDAVRLAAGLAQPGDAVLMSPACASFDMFRNYLHRAEVFIAAVQGLAE